MLYGLAAFRCVSGPPDMCLKRVRPPKWVKSAFKLLCMQSLRLSWVDILHIHIFSIVCSQILVGSSMIILSWWQNHIPKSLFVYEVFAQNRIFIYFFFIVTRNFVSTSWHKSIVLQELDNGFSLSFNDIGLESFRSDLCLGHS